MRYKQYRLAKRNGELVQQIRTMEIIITNKWYKPWAFEKRIEYSEWVDIPILEVEPDYTVCTLEEAESFAKKRNYPL